MSITCHCYLQGRPRWDYCGGCSRSEHELAVLDAGLYPYAEALAEEQPVAEEESADG